MNSPLGSRLQHLTSTNEELSSSECFTIRKHYIENSEEILAALNDQIAQAQAAVAQAQAMVDSLTKRSEEHKEDKKNYPKGYRTVGPAPGFNPLLITHICSAWRRVAFSSPILWTTIRPECIFDEQCLGRFLTWLGRTGASAPLDIDFRGHPDFPGNDASKKSRVPLVWMRPHMHRIRNLSLGGPLGELPQGNFDTLETLMIRNITLQKSSSGGTERFTPFLRQVAFHGKLVRLDFIPFPQLTYLSIHLRNDHRVRPGVLLGIFSLCTALVTLIVRCVILDDNDTGDEAEADQNDKTEGGYGAVEGGDDEPIMLECLTSLCMGVGSDSAWLLAHLTLPSLTDLILYGMDCWSASVYRTFRSRSTPPLRRLELYGSKMSLGSFLDVLTHTPSLTDVISVDSVSMTEALAEALTWDGDDGTPKVGPNLEYLCCDDTELSSGNWFNRETIGRMIYSRNSSGEPVHTDSYRFYSVVRVYRASCSKKPSWDQEIQEIKRREQRSFRNRGLALHVFF